MNLGPEDRATGKENFQAAVGSPLVREKLMQEIVAHKLSSGNGIGARFFGYGAEVSPPVRIGVIGTGDEGGVLIGALNPKYVQVVAIADIRPFNVYRAFNGDKSSAKIRAIRTGLMKKYGWKTEEEARQHVKVYTKRYEELLDNPDVEAVIIALPLHLHAVASIKAMRKGKHVLCEKLMAHSVRECKEVARVAQQTGKLMVVGHQRHYSVLHDNAVDLIRRGLIGDVHHIRAQWHREKDTWKPAMPDAAMREQLAAISIPAAEAKKNLADVEKKVADAKSELAAATKQDPKKLKELEKLEENRNKVRDRANDLATREEILTHQLLDAELETSVKNYGYVDRMVGENQVPALEELIRWRLFNRTGGGLMAELGSHQLDASGIFISSLRDDHQHVHPLSVSALGGRELYPHDRDIDDHVYCTYEYPGPKYDAKTAPEKKIVVTYSAINGNGFGDYGETVLGTKGTLLLDQEKDVLLYRAWNTSEYAKVGGDEKRQQLEAGARGTREAALGQMALKEPMSKGYTEEIEHWAWSIRNPGKEPTPRCVPKVALADAVIALTTNIAIAEGRRIEFDPAWFDPDSDETPNPQLGKPDVNRPEYGV
ncbi:MAG: Gfo/Idh/MocA family oxidoreductase [Planctomycetia bacterium]|nr:Gfo/Idh/MocA family oxidoreductase [Planctomycetia bacterium]